MKTDACKQRFECRSLFTSSRPSARKGQGGESKGATLRSQAILWLAIAIATCNVFCFSQFSNDRLPPSGATNRKGSAADQVSQKNVPVIDDFRIVFISCGRDE